MHRTVPLSTQVYNRLYPYPVKDRDPVSWQDHVKKHLVMEMRVEVQLFYGVDAESTTSEARFPGYDYSNPHHRLRLRRHAFHRRLFRAFDDLRLTESEIYNLCDWEGTLIVRRRFEAQNGVKLRDTTGDDIVRRQMREQQREEAERMLQVQQQARTEDTGKAEEEDDDDDEEDVEGEEEEDGEEEGQDIGIPGTESESEDDEEDEDDEDNDARYPPGAVQNLQHNSAAAHARRLVGNTGMSRGTTPTASVAA